ncbi:MAG: VOC family protein [Myxococcota bacterium]
MLSHLSLGIRELARSRDFYDAVLAALGFERVWTGERGLGYGADGREPLNLFVVAPDADPSSGAAFHLAFRAPDRASVDAFHLAALANGGTDAGAPGPRPQYSATYYAAFVLDPDGHKLEAVHQ